jgi:hypothetical protein
MATWSQLTFLTAPQQALAAQFEAVGRAITDRVPHPPIGTLTLQQAKAAERLFRELMDLVGPAMRGANEVADRHYAANKAAFDAANP